MDKFSNFSETVEICCNLMHVSCYSGKNENVKFTLGSQKVISCHFPLLHLHFFKDYYTLIKAALKHLIIVAAHLI